MTTMSEVAGPTMESTIPNYMTTEDTTTACEVSTSKVEEKSSLGRISFDTTTIVTEATTEPEREESTSTEPTVLVSTDTEDTKTSVCEMTVSEVEEICSMEQDNKRTDFF